MSSAAIVRFLTLVLAEDAYLDEERARLRLHWRRPVTIGEARRGVRRVHWCHLIGWMQQQFQRGQTPQSVADQIAA